MEEKNEAEILVWFDLLYFLKKLSCNKDGWYNENIVKNNVNIAEKSNLCFLIHLIELVFLQIYAIKSV